MNSPRGVRDGSQGSRQAQAVDVGGAAGLRDGSDSDSGFGAYSERPAPGRDFARGERDVRDYFGSVKAGGSWYSEPEMPMVASNAFL
ncbi:hypothetical protein GCM10012286_12290 [Streptomyces lasiicapitis]|uniref:Uncharacterized protein n=1 Tax=Streptomyces lasiicapitis TaxID=1923961 RepID=A0ABQ2LKH5_9ACTN|nr:hypothetical protein GCM10012286_12290 [Streptomyces lasiicapitis]